MDNNTLINTTRILQFLQRFKLDFNEHTVWSYSRKKFHDSACTKVNISEALKFLELNGYIEKLIQPGYYRLSEKGNKFTTWDKEKTASELIAAKPIQKGWINWLLPRKKAKESA
jgi:hypothetical protein